MDKAFSFSVQVVKADMIFQIFLLAVVSTVSSLSSKSASITAPTPAAAPVSKPSTPAALPGGKTSAPAAPPGGKPSTPAAPTTTPIQCYVGVCNGTSACVNSTSTLNTAKVVQQTCAQGQSCALVQKKINGTYSVYNHSCSADCKQLTSQGKVACCENTNCTPDLSKPIHSSGDAAVPMSLVSFLGLAIMSVSLI